MKPQLLAFAGLSLLTAVSLQGQTSGRSGATNPPPSTTTNDAGQAKPASTNTFLKATIHSSRSEVTIDGAYGLFADLENVSPVDVTIFEDEIQMVVQPEVTGSGVCSWRLAGWFPTEDREGKLVTKPATKPESPTSPGTTPATGADHAHPGGRLIKIRPQEHYTVFWDLSRRNTRPTTEARAAANPASPKDAAAQRLAEQQADDVRRCSGTSYFWWLNFAPGEYLFTIDAKFYLPEPADDRDYHTFTQTTQLKLTIPQFYSMWAAAFGSVLAYLVTILGAGATADSRAGLVKGMVVLRNVASSALLGAAITIVVSRLSDTQFPIKVSVNDIWGAITVGFVSYFAGNKIIDKLKKL
jgi:hypothetical protein